MGLREIHLQQQEQVVDALRGLLGTLGETEQLRDATSSPLELRRWELDISRLKQNIERYRRELTAIERDLNQQFEPEPFPPQRSYRAVLDDEVDPEELDRKFALVVRETLRQIDHRVSDTNEAASFSWPTFIAEHDGDFLRTTRSLFRCLFGVIDESIFLKFVADYQDLRKKIDLDHALLVSNTHVSPAVWKLANHERVQILTFEELFDSVFNAKPYLARCTLGFETSRFAKTYIAVKYLRRGHGKFVAYGNEVVVTAAADGSSFEAKGDLTQYVDSWLSRKGRTQLCVLGDYGTGKTSFAKHYFQLSASRYAEDPLTTRIPLLVPLHRYHKAASIEQMMTDFLVNEVQIRRNFETFMKVAERGKFLIILDGFDEMAQQVDLNVRRKNFNEISKLLVGDNRIILFGRPNYFLGRTEAENLLNPQQTPDPYSRALNRATTSGAYEVVTLSLFDEWQINDFLEAQIKFSKSQNDERNDKGVGGWRELRETIRKTYNLEELARTPVLLEIIFRTLPALRGEVPYIDPAELYRIYTEFWLKREEKEHDVRHLIGLREKELFVQELAWAMLNSGSEQGEIHFTRLSERVGAYFDLTRANEIDYFSSDIRLCTFLTHSENDGNYRFIHKSFMEYFAAKYLCSAMFDERDLSEVDNFKAVTPDVLFFFCQMIDPRKIESLCELRRQQSSVRTPGLLQFTAQVLRETFNLNMSRGTIPLAEQAVEALHRYCAEFEFVEGQLWAWQMKGELAQQAGRHREAVEYYSSALELSRSLLDLGAEAGALTQLGTSCSAMGELDRSLSHHLVARAIFERIADQRGVALATIQIGQIALLRFELSGAAEAFALAVKLSESSGDKASLGQALLAMGNLQAQQGKVEEALRVMLQARALFRELGKSQLEQRTLIEVADMNLRMARFEEAERICRNVLDACRDRDDDGTRLGALGLLGRVNSSLGKFEESRANSDEALALARRLGDRRAVAETLIQRGLAVEQLGQHAAAIEAMREAIRILRELSEVHKLAIALNELATICVEAGEADESDALLHEAHTLFTRVDDTRRIARVTREQAASLERKSDFACADRLYRAAVNVSQTDPLATAQSLEALGDFASRRGDSSEAEANYIRVLSNESYSRRAKCALYAKLARLLLPADRVPTRGSPNRQTAAFGYYERHRELARELQIAFDEELEREFEREKVSRKRRTEPSILNRPLKVREQAIESLIARVQKPGLIMLVGQPGMGKTRILARVDEELKRPTMPVLVNLQEFPAQAESVLGGIVRAIFDQLTAAGLLSPRQSPPPSLTYANEFGKAIDSLVGEATENGARLRLVLLLDDMDRMADTGPQWTQILLSLSQYKYLTVVASVSKAPRIQPGIETVSVLPLNQADTSQLITEHAKAHGVEVLRSGLEQAYRLSRGTPKHVRVLASRLVSFAQSVRRSISNAEVDAIVPEVIAELEVVFLEQWRSLTSTQQGMLVCIATDRNPRRDAPAFNELLDREILELGSDGRPQFKSGLLRAWTREFEWLTKVHEG